METKTAPKEYPENWDQHAQASAESETTFKIKAGQAVRMHILSGPLIYREEYFEIGTKDDGQPKKMRIALPFGAQLPGFKLKTKYLAEVLILDGPSKGQNKLFEFGKQIADQLEAVKNTWGSTRVPDLVVSRKGSTKDDTKYTVVAAPASIKIEDCPVQYDLEVEVRYANKADLLKLPPAPSGTAAKDSLGGVISVAQAELIEGLCKEKQISAVELGRIIERKLGKAGSIGDLTMGMASGVIDVLKNY